MYFIRSKINNIKIIPRVDIEEFIHEPYFAGKITRNGTAIFDIWKKSLIEIFKNKRKTEVILTGAIGIGKSTVAVLAKGYIAYRVLLMENPQEYFGFPEKDPVVLAFINLTNSLSKSGNFVKFSTLISNSQVFKDLGVKFSTRTAVPYPIFPKGLEYVVGSAFAKGFGVVGKNIISSTLDEISEVQDSKKDQQKIIFSQRKALKLYRTVAKRITSRFMGTTELAKLFLISSKNEKDMFLETYVKKVERMHHVAIYDFPLWQAKPEKYSGKFFFVGINKIKQILMSDTKDSLPNDITVYKIPVEHKNEFKLDAVTALADFAGISTNIQKLVFFRNYMLLKGAFKIDMPCPDVITLNLHDDTKILNNFDIDKLLQYKDKQLTLHLDTATKNDLFGIGASFIDSYDNVILSTDDIKKDLFITNSDDIDVPESIKTIEKQERTFKIPKIIVPFAFGITTEDEIPLWKVREFIMQLRLMGFVINLVSTDGWQSIDMRQLLDKEGFRTTLLSVDRTINPYSMFKSHIYNSRILMCKNRRVFKEMKNLLDLGLKVDHPEDGSKDISDGIVGAVYHNITEPTNQITNKERLDLYLTGLSQLNNQTIKKPDQNNQEIVDKSKLLLKLFK